jgi:hypothetical protein
MYLSFLTIIFKKNERIYFGSYSTQLEHLARVIWQETLNFIDAINLPKRKIIVTNFPHYSHNSFNCISFNNNLRTDESYLFTIWTNSKPYHFILIKIFLYLFIARCIEFYCL